MSEEVLVLEETTVKPKKTRTKKVAAESLTDADLTIKVKKVKVPKPKKEKPARDLRTMFRAKLAELDIERMKKPWMAEKSFRLIYQAEELQQWVDSLMSDTSRHYDTPGGRMPVVAVDTETIGLDTRIIVEWIKEWGPAGEMLVPLYEVKMEIAGICLSADGIEGLYIPINHEDGKNLSREAANRILQPLFDHSHQIYYNAKFDREVLRQTLGIQMRDYPYFEDVQAINYINDPKADLGDRGQFTGGSGGLKGLSKHVLGIEQIELDELGRVKADFVNSKTRAVSQRIQYVPFTWIPTEAALWYAAGDAICTWLLWHKLCETARKRKAVHRIDHVMIDSLTWLERQRYLIDTERHGRTVHWHQNKLKTLREKLRAVAISQGHTEIAEDDGSVLLDNQFNPDSNPQVCKFVFGTKALRVIRRSKQTGNPSFDSEVVTELQKLYPDDEFLTLFSYYKDYVALHPENLQYDPNDHSARVYLKACVVAGGRLAASGGDFEVDGGFGLNIQGIKRIESHLMWKVKGRVLVPDTIDPADVEEYTEADLDKSCFKMVEKVEKVQVGEETYYEEVSPIDADWDDERPEPVARTRPVYEERRSKVQTKAPGVINNHVGQYLGYAICLVPECKSCAQKYGVLIEKGKLDANEIVNLRCLFTAPKGWTFFTVDYSNIEMRAAANLSGEPEFIKEFLEGSGDFHSLTASKVFPEFNDPATPKDVKKSLRSLAKIINFALLYGGTEHTIFENMRKQDPTMTFEKAKAMVDAYWVGVPVFAAWCQNKQRIARDELYCSTATGRVIDFNSGMAALGIHPPTKDETKNYWHHRQLVGKERSAKKVGNKELETRYRDEADKMWRDATTGVRNAGDYNQFMGKIGRVSVNVPVQGLAGDFMRMSLNKIYQWAAIQCPEIQSILRFHGSVHDECDFAVKNEYVAYVLPRITRLMKLRTLHKAKKWSVPIECDAEYGPSWDVEHHLTGDDSHAPAGWTEIAGMERYVPDEFDSDTVNALLRSLASEDEARLTKARHWLEMHLHPRAVETVNNIFKAQGKVAILKALIASLQLHEFWTVDQTPDEDESKMETLEAYEARCGLTASDRGFMPEGGFIGAIPLAGRVRRPNLPVLNEEKDAPAPESTPEEEIPVGVDTTSARRGPSSFIDMSEFEKPRSLTEALPESMPDLYKISEPLDIPVEEAPPAPVLMQPVTEAEMDSLLLDIPIPRRQPETVIATPVPSFTPSKKKDIPKGLPIIKPLTEQDAIALREALGVGRQSIHAVLVGQIVWINRVSVTEIPTEFVIGVTGE
jgi:DNA polymerase I-like protein with 3'-5' exonuclease and polymerase domains